MFAFCLYHGRIVVKSDGVNAAQDLMNELARERKELPTVVETSKPMTRRAMGERAVQFGG